MKIKDLIEKINVLNVHGDLNRNIEDLTFDSRKSGKETAFVAIQGLVQDGHDFIKSLSSETEVVFHEKELEEYSKTKTYIRLENTRKDMANIAALLNDFPSKKMKVFGITGTNGKTSTTYMVKHLLETMGEKVATIGTNGVTLGNESRKLEHTTPESPELQKLFKEFVEKRVDSVVMEVSSHAIELFRVDCIDFDYGIFTNLSIEHLDFHETMENYYLAKKKLFDRLHKTGIVNVDNSYGKRLYEEERDKCKSLGRQGDYAILDLKQVEGGYHFIFQTPKEEMDLTLPTTALFNVYNTLQAISICIEAGYPLKELVQAMETFPGAEGRMETIPNKLGITMMIDFAHSPDAIKNILTSIQPKGRKIVIFGVTGDRNKEFRLEMGKTVGKYADYSFLTIDDPKKDTIDNINLTVEEGLKSVEASYEREDNREKAIEKAIDYALPGDALLFLGKGHERFLKINGKKIDFDEREIISQYLKKKS